MLRSIIGSFLISAFFIVIGALELLSDAPDWRFALIYSGLAAAFYIIAMAAAHLQILKRDFDQLVDAIHKLVEKASKTRSVPNILVSFDIPKKGPTSNDKLEDLKKELEKALEEEDYERAAELKKRIELKEKEK